MAEIFVGLISLLSILSSAQATQPTSTPRIQLQDLKPSRATPDPNYLRRVQAPTGHGAKGDTLVVCRIPRGKSGVGVNDYATFIINDPMGYQTCSERGGHVTTGNMNDRGQMDVEGSSKSRNQRHEK